MTGIAVGLATLLGAGGSWAGVVAVAGAVLVVLVAGGRGWIWAVLLVPLAALGASRAADGEQTAWPSLMAGEVTLQATVVSGPMLTGSAQRFELEALLPSSAAQADTPVKLCAVAPVVPALGYGDFIEVTGRVRSSVELRQEFAASLRSRGCSGSLEASAVAVIEEGRGARASLDRLRRRLSSTLANAIAGDSGALMVGLVTGDDLGLPRERRADFIITGTSHVTAISGSNLAMIASMLTVAGGTTGIGRRWLWQGAILAALWSYVLLVGAPPPALRAALVASLAAIALLIGRRPDFVTLGVVVASAQILVFPEHFSTLSYRLSTVAALSLVLVLAGREPRGWRGLLGRGVVATAATQMATSALLIPTFGQFPVYAVPANLVIAPLCALAFPIALLAGVAGFASQSVAEALAVIAAVPAYLALEAAAFFAGLPGASTELGSEWLPRWIWMAAGVSVVAGLSRECRLAIARAADTLVTGPERTAAVGFSGAVGLLAGLALASVLL